MASQPGTTASVSTAGPAPLTITPCVVDAVHDGDTVHVRIPLQALWPELAGGVNADVRVAHVNAAELATTAGKAAAAAVTAWLSDPGRSPVRLHVYGRDKYGRLLADLETPAGELLSAFVLTLTGTVPLNYRAQLRAER